MRIFTVYDAKAEAYLQPFFEKTVGLAMRAFETAVQDPNHNFNRYAEDYSLWLIGHFDEETAAITQDKTSTLIAKAHELKGHENAEDSAVAPSVSNGASVQPGPNGGYSAK